MGKIGLSPAKANVDLRKIGGKRSKNTEPASMAGSIQMAKGGGRKAAPLHATAKLNPSGKGKQSSGYGY